MAKRGRPRKDEVRPPKHTELAPTTAMRVALMRQVLSRSVRGHDEATISEDLAIPPEHVREYLKQAIHIGRSLAARDAASLREIELNRIREVVKEVFSAIDIAKTKAQLHLLAPLLRVALDCSKAIVQLHGLAPNININIPIGFDPGKLPFHLMSLEELQEFADGRMTAEDVLAKYHVPEVPVIDAEFTVEPAYEEEPGNEDRN